MKRARAGRKPSGPFKNKISTFSTRIDPETRALLEARRAQTGHSISQVAEGILKDALKSPRRKRVEGRIPHREALLSLIGMVVMRAEENTGEQWNTKRFTFERVKSAIMTILDEFAPSGKSEVPERLKASLRRRMVEPDDDDEDDVVSGTAARQLADPDALGFFDGQHLASQVRMARQRSGPEIKIRRSITQERGDRIADYSADDLNLSNIQAALGTPAKKES